ncbi:MAG: cobyric acid synthase [Chloroflexota bacterium]|nr:cobyric acid synthase [Chloroflexota bacterium]
MVARVLMVQGASSSAGKSLLVTALCRVFARRGVRVAPFKAQNMSNNAAVCADGSEIGRAQAVQAAAAGVEPTPDMNPVLLKPEADSRSQVVVMGRVWRTLRAGEYYRAKKELWPVVTAAFDRLRAAYDLVVVEGAGSPAELNLREGDIVNMAVALYARSPVLLVGDIDRGGIFAQLLGTLWLLAPDERALVRGLVVNKFRGDPALFTRGVSILEEKGGVAVLGVVPFIRDLSIPEEDSVALDQALRELRPCADEVEVAVVRLPHIANFDDFAPLAAEERVRVRYVASPEELGRPHAVVLPGTKTTMPDLAWLWERGLAQAVLELARAGASIVGICGGYQMLGKLIRDPLGVESSTPELAGLGLLPVETAFEREKATHRVRARVLGGPGWLGQLEGLALHGYEIHMGSTGGGRAWLEISQRSGAEVRLSDGAVDGSGRVWGCYLHGLFENEALRRAWLASLGWRGPNASGRRPAHLDASLDRLADVVEASLDMRRLEAIVWGG